MAAAQIAEHIFWKHIICIAWNIHWHYKYLCSLLLLHGHCSFYVSVEKSTGSAAFILSRTGDLWTSNREETEGGQDKKDWGRLWQKKNSPKMTNSYHLTSWEEGGWFLSTAFKVNSESLVILMEQSLFLMVLCILWCHKVKMHTLLF